MALRLKWDFEEEKSPHELRDLVRYAPSKGVSIREWRCPCFHVAPTIVRWLPDLQTHHRIYQAYLTVPYSQ